MLARRLAWSLGLVCLALPACDQIGKVSACRAVAGLLERASTDVAGASKTPTARSYRAAAQRYRMLAGELRAQRFPTKAGETLLSEYVSTLEPLRAAAERYARALEQKNVTEKQAVKREVERIGRREQTASGRLRSYCRGP